MMKQGTYRPEITWEIEQKPTDIYWGLISYYKELTPLQQRTKLLESVQNYWGLSLKPELGLGVKKTKQQAWISVRNLMARLDEICASVEIEEDVNSLTKITPIGYIPERGVNWKFTYRPKDEQGKFVETFRQENSCLQKIILEAGIAYWDFFAWQQLGILTQKQLLISAKNCLVRLKRQISFLMNYFELVPRLPINNDWTMLEQQKPQIVNQPIATVIEEEELKVEETDSFDESLLNDPSSIEYGLNLFPDSFN